MPALPARLEDEPSPALRRSMAACWEFHARADLDAFVETVLEAKRAGPPVVLGLEVDYYRGHMDQVAALLDDLRTVLTFPPAEVLQRALLQPEPSEDEIA